MDPFSRLDAMSYAKVAEVEGRRGSAADRDRVPSAATGCIAGIRTQTDCEEARTRTLLRTRNCTGFDRILELSIATGIEQKAARMFCLLLCAGNDFRSPTAGFHVEEVPASHHPCVRKAQNERRNCEG